ncbi:MAG TPA: hypothetical protein VE343_13990 [Streptosporangiaceae bacterium]|nr:hypothetical protein [Streptosporangiaceae bacterium]
MLCAPVAVRAGLLIASLLWAWRIYAVETGLSVAHRHGAGGVRPAAVAPATERCPGRSVIAREDVLVPLVCQFITERILGPERGALLSAQIPADAAARAARTERQRAALAKELRRLDVAQDSQIRELDTLPADPGNRAAQAMRARIRDHFAELVTQRDQAHAALDALTRADQQASDPELLEALPVLAARLDDLPPRHRAALYQALDIQLLYSRELHQVTIYGTITDHTPQALTWLITDSEPPAPGATTRGQAVASTLSSDFTSPL